MQYGDRKWQYNIFYSRLFIFYYYYFFPRRLQMQSQLLGFPILVAIEHGLKKLISCMCSKQFRIANVF